jgi:hypothetical protein
LYTQTHMSNCVAHVGLGIRLLSYRFPKPSRTGQLSMQLEPLDFLERISRFIPYPRRHRRHYHGIFASSSPMRKQLVASAQKRVETARQEVQRGCR